MTTTPADRAPRGKPVNRWGLPAPQGLYDPRFEHDACGVNFVCNLRGEASHEIVAYGVEALCNLQHRGALGAEKNSGDGAGILMQIPDGFYRESVDFDLPEAGRYATGMAFLPGDPAQAEEAVVLLEALADDEDLQVHGWRDLPTDDSMLGLASRAAQPVIRQLFLT